MSIFYILEVVGSGSETQLRVSEKKKINLALSMLMQRWYRYHNFGFIIYIPRNLHSDGWYQYNVDQCCLLLCQYHQVSRAIEISCYHQPEKETLPRIASLSDYVIIW